VQLLTAKETSSILRITTQRLYEMAREGLIPSVRIGGCVRFEQAQLQAWVRSGGSASSIGRHGPTSSEGVAR
jgi:excisionase family DNA binding protein